MKQKRFAEFYQFGVMTGQLIGGCGSDSVLTLDGRLSIENAAQVARKVCAQRQWAGFELRYGTHTQSRVIRPMEVII